MNTHEEVMLWHALYQLETRYWHEVDANGGRNAHEFYLPDGLMVVGHNRFQGRDKIKEFYAWRERQAVTAISSGAFAALASAVSSTACRAAVSIAAPPAACTFIIHTPSPAATLHAFATVLGIS